jgi:hypothetical protein
MPSWRWQRKLYLLLLNSCIPSSRLLRLSQFSLGPIYRELHQLQPETNHTYQVLWSSRSKSMEFAPHLPSYSCLSDFEHTEQPAKYKKLFGRCRFEFRPRHWQHCMKVSWIFSVFKQMRSYCLKLSQDRFLPHPFQFIIHCYSIIRRCVIWITENVVKYTLQIVVYNVFCLWLSHNRFIPIVDH